MSFLVTGLPRSGTAWMANFLNWKQLTCRHEMIMKCKTFDDYILMHKNGIGNSDSGILLYYDEIRKALPDLPLVVITRPIDEVKSSLEKLGMPLYYDRMRTKYLKAIEEADLVITYPTFRDKNIARLIWNTVGGNDYHFDESRHAMLADLRVTRTMDKFRHEVTKFLINIDQGKFPNI